MMEKPSGGKKLESTHVIGTCSQHVVRIPNVLLTAESVCVCVLRMRIAYTVLRMPHHWSQQSGRLLAEGRGHLMHVLQANNSIPQPQASSMGKSVMTLKVDACHRAYQI
jgi:hypothetical protein